MIQKNENILLRSIKQIRDEDTQMAHRQLVDEHFLVVEVIYTGVMRDAARLKKLLTDSKGLIFDTGVFTEEGLVDLLRKAKLPKGLSFPFELEVAGLHELEEVSTVSVSAVGMKIITVIGIPLVDFQAFDVMLMHSIPVRTTNGYHSYLEASNALLVVHGATHQYVPMTEGQLNCCKRVRGQYLCTDSLPIQKIRVTSPCEVRMYLSPDKIPETCRTRHLRLQGLTLIKMRKTNAWFYVAPEPEAIAIACGEGKIRDTLQGSGIMRIEDFCEVIAPDFTIRGRKSKETIWENHIQPRLNLTLSNDTITQLQQQDHNVSDIRLTNVIGNLKELEDLHVQLETEKEDLGKLQKKFDYQEFLLHPSSIFSVVMVVLALV
ncbi:uncharacterized protein LOC135159937 [Diachasmimorpha longicaudata]|uniref:uncharacterized protein LOC135159937 n=1 Tax=Diachasmimorpha longicaudata TaxID=58733 RepID=UPI0030B8DC34